MSKNKNKVQNIYQLSPMQAGMLFYSIMDHEKNTYFRQARTEINGKLDMDIFRRSFDILKQRHDILRTIFLYQKVNEPLQVVLKEKESDISYKDIFYLEENRQQSFIEEFIKKDAERSFDLSKDVLFRITVFRIGRESYKVIWSFNHIIMDGWCLGILLKELLYIYKSIRNKTPLKLNKVYPYSQYIKWIQNQDKEQVNKYWSNFLEGYNQSVVVPKSRSINVFGEYRREQYTFEIDQQTTMAMENMSKINQVTMNIVFEAVWGILLQKYNNVDDIVFGTVVSGRPVELEGSNSMLGLFINTIPMRIKCEGSKAFSEILKETQTASLNSERYSYSPLNEIQAVTPLKQDLINHILVFENYPLGDEIERLNKSGVLGFSLHGFELVEKTNYDFNIIASYDGNIKVNLIYNADVYDKAFIRRIEGHFKSVTKAVVNDFSIAVKDIDVITAEEKNQILYDFNNTCVEYQKSKTLHCIFGEQVERTPNNTAVIFGDKTLTYRELDEKTNQIARVLREKGLGRNGIAAIMVERSLEMIVGIVGILKAGGAYMPISPSYPEERIKFMLKDSGAKLLIIQKHFIDKINFQGEIINLDDEISYSEDASSMEDINSPSDLAYIIYTSGSTGMPKGVMIEHQSTINRLNWMQKEYPIDAKDVILQKTPFTFDVSVWELFWWFFSGAGVCVLEPEGEKNIDAIVRAIEKNRITTIHFVPSMLSTFLEYMDNRDILKRLSTLRQVFASGEALSLFQVERFNNTLNKTFNTKLHNLYGPTEATVDVSYFPCSTGEKIDVVPIGKPIDNICLYILNKDGGLQPVGISGELYIAGDGLARGYLNRPELTAEKFVDNPFSQGKKMYKSGDLARWMPDGNIEYQGRLDNQVKIRGFRIELGEIEAKLLKHSFVKETVVIAREDKNANKYICGYIVGSVKLDSEEIKEFLLSQMPDYMVPAYIMQIERLPLSPNGKIDRKLLPDPVENIRTTVEYTPARNKIEEKLVSIWQAVLGIEKVGINDKFSSFGGDSIKAIQIVGRLYKENLKLEIKDLFQYGTIAKLSSRVESTIKDIYQETVIGEVRLTPIQKWFFEKKSSVAYHFNQSVLLQMKVRLDEGILKAVFNKIVEHHDALRMVYRIEGQEVVQFNRDTHGKALELKVVDLTDCENYKEHIEKTTEELQRSMSLENGPIIKLAMFKTYREDYLFIVIHHLVVDGVSWRILLQDFVDCYKEAAEGGKIQLPQKTDSYKEWADRLYEYANSSELLQEIEFWKMVEDSSIVSLPKDANCVSDTMRDSSVMEVSLSEEDTLKLLTNVNNAYNTEINDILLSALAMALKQWTGQDKAIINMEGHGREEINTNINLTRTVGWFTSIYPILLDMKFCEDISYHIRYVKESIRRIPNKGMGYGVLKYLTSDENKKNVELKLCPEICFNYLGQFGMDMDTEMFSMSDIYAGSPVSPETSRPYKFDINGMIVNGKLVFTFNYNKYEYNEASVFKFTDNFKSSLEKIIQHCVQCSSTILTPSDFGDNKLPMEDFEYIMEQTEGNIQHIYPLSPMQEGILFHSLMDSSSNTYFEQASITIKGNLDIEVFEKSFKALVEGYDVLRTMFIYDRVQAMRQVVLEKVDSNVFYKDISYLNNEEILAFLEEFKVRDRKNGFDLSKASLMRMSVFKTGKEGFEIIWSYHHIIMDGWCMAIIFKNLFKLYRGLKEFKSFNWEKPAPYYNFIKWLEKQDSKAAEIYWKEYLHGYDSQSSLPGRVNLSDKVGYVQEEISFIFDKDIVKGLLHIAKEINVTVNTVFQTLWGILLQRYNNTEDVVFGGVVSGRPSELEGIETMVGLFINTLPVRVKSGSITFDKLLEDIHANALKSQNYDYYSLANIQSASPLKQALLEHIIIFENYPVEKDIEDGKNNGDVGLRIESVKVFEQTNYNFEVVVFPGEEFEIKFRYNSLVYDRDIVKSISSHLVKAAGEVIRNPYILTDKIDILTAEERNLILGRFNETALKYDYEKTIQQLFEEQVEKTPDKTALVFGNKVLTYRCLNLKANSLARILRRKGVKPNCIVGLMVQRSMEMIVGILAILKAGGAYLPIDPEYPAERVKYVLEDSGADILLTQSGIKDSVKFSGHIMDLMDESLYGGEALNLESVNTFKDLAYVIYTSGSTGRPKGVLIEHMAVNNFIKGITDRIEFKQDNNILALTTISFDIFLLETLLPLTKGLMVVIANETQQTDAKELGDVIKENDINMMQATPSRLQLLIDEDSQLLCLKNLQVIMIGGEALPRKLVETVKELTDAKIYNMYGPTETTVWSAIKDLTQNKEVSLGRPIANTQIYIVDKNNSIQPIGVVGELCIAGDGLARGYNKSELTEEKFIQNPFEVGKMMYRTGDLARWLSDGELEFLGRLDYQVKIRGFRIEIGEIEEKLLKHQEVKEVAVIVKEEASGIKYLCAYIVTNSKVIATELREYLVQELPEYMIPSYFMVLDKMPLTPNGKINRKGLPEQEERTSSAENFAVAENQVEEKITEIWKDILKIDIISVNDNFFMVGGHSLRASVMISRMHKIFNIRIPLKMVFQIPTIRQLAAYVKKTDKNMFHSIKRVEDMEYYPVSSAQRSMLIVEQYGGVGTSYNMPITCIVVGDIDKRKFDNAFKKLVERHESLRTSFEIINGAPVQRIYKEVDFQMYYSEGEEEDINSYIDSFVRPFELGNAPLLRAALVKLSPKKHLLLIDMHHIVGDGTSLSLMVHEIVDIYRGKELSDLKIQYRDFVEWQNKFLESEHIKETEKYWLNRFSGEIPILNIPTDFKRPQIKSYVGKNVNFLLNEELTARLKSLADENGATMYMMLMTVFNILLARYTGQEDIIVGSGISGRQHVDVENVVGMFVNSLGMRNRPEGNKMFLEFLKEVKENSIKAYENQDYQFEKLVDKLKLKRDLSRSPLFDVAFIMENMELPHIEFENLKFIPYSREWKTSKLDITFFSVEEKGGISCTFEYCTALFKRQSIEQMAGCFVKIIELVTANENIKIKDIELINQDEKHEIISEIKKVQNFYESLDDEDFGEIF
ncbi:non-ribosomal peptide synthetase [Clostridium estertheticum]|uniref:non-ribosomal peptide synthetase n=1 Tax=Clostridium estertheticum TaxID=238834 RepID=UPI001CF1C259|nr:non-ribosomal peptide synthetase [Clostridium estertheticum]MCB2354692.1 amino acid adenylation domain-containing protein [Clostridium estertheticum]WAG40937.1 amino acid adenylation domain-containing protein [Clostridium estertheticum]